MTTVQTQEQLLLRLAANGDPSAFYTLIAPFANVAYIAERNSGKGHSEALSALLPCFKKIYTTFSRDPVHGAFGDWYKEQEKKVFTNTQEIAIENLSGQGTHGLLTTDMAHFDWVLNVVFQRQYGKLKRPKKQNPLKRSTIALPQKRWLVKLVVGICLLACMSAGILGYLSFSKKQLEVTLVSQQPPQSMLKNQTLPNFFGQGTLISFKSTTQAEISASLQPLKPTVVFDTIKIHDTLRLPNRFKPSVGQVANPNFSAAVKNTPNLGGSSDSLFMKTPSIKTTANISGSQKPLQPSLQTDKSLSTGRSTKEKQVFDSIR